MTRAIPDPRLDPGFAAGLPLEVRDPLATRYFMTASEAGQLLILAAGLAGPGDLLALNTGTPLRIEELARRLLAATAAENSPTIGSVMHTQLATGEKRHELLCGDLTQSPTESPWISRLAVTQAAPERLEEGVAALRPACGSRDVIAVAELLRTLALGGGA